MRSSTSCILRLGLHCKICGRCISIVRAQFVSTHRNIFPGEVVCSDCRGQNNFDSIIRELEK
jgi:hypothetical protein